jgi:hypothetical protein
MGSRRFVVVGVAVRLDWVQGFFATDMDLNQLVFTIRSAGIGSFLEFSMNWAL